MSLLKNEHFPKKAIKKFFIFLIYFKCSKLTYGNLKLGSGCFKKTE